MSKVILYTRQDGGLSIIYPNYANKPEDMTNAEFEDHVMQTQVPDGSSGIKKVDDSNVLSDRTFRNAWKSHYSQVQVDMDKAKDIQRDRIRAVREKVLEDLDTEYMKAEEAANNSLKQAIAQKKQELRDATADAAIDAATTPEELKVIFPAGLDDPDSIVPTTVGA